MKDGEHGVRSEPESTNENPEKQPVEWNKEKAREELKKMVDEFIDADYEVPGMTQESWIKAFHHDLGQELESKGIEPEDEVQFQLPPIKAFTNATLYVRKKQDVIEVGIADYEDNGPDIVIWNSADSWNDERYHDRDIRHGDFKIDVRDFSTTDLHLRPGIKTVSVDPWSLLRNSIENQPMYSPEIQRLMLECLDGFKKLVSELVNQAA